MLDILKEAFQTTSRHDQKRKMSHHIKTKMPKLKNKEKMLNTARENCQLTNNGKHKRITSELTAQTLKARKAWINIIQVQRVNNCQPPILYPLKLSFNLDEETRTFWDKDRQKQI
jgi:hypothetical protein